MRSAFARLADQLQAWQLGQQCLVDPSAFANEDQSISGLKSCCEDFRLFDSVCEHRDAMIRELGEAPKSPYSVLVVVGDDDIHRVKVEVE